MGVGYRCVGVGAFHVCVLQVWLTWVYQVSVFAFVTGVAPPSILAVQAGTTLYQLTSSSDAFSLTSIVSPQTPPMSPSVNPSVTLIILELTARGQDLLPLAAH